MLALVWAAMRLSRRWFAEPIVAGGALEDPSAAQRISVNSDRRR